MEKKHIMGKNKIFNPDFFLNNSKLQNYITLVLVVFATAFCFQVAWQGDVVEIMLQVEKIKDINFLNRDFYVNTFNTFSPRYSVGFFIYLINKSTSFEYTYIIAFLNIIRILCTILFVFLLIEKLIKNREAALLITLLIAINHFSFPLVPIHFFNKDLTGHGISTMFTLIAFYCVLKKKLAISILFSCFSLFFHPVMAILSIPIILIILVFDYAYFLTHIFKPISLLFTFCFFLLLIYFNLKHNEALIGANILDSKTFVSILFGFRHPYYLFKNFDFIHSFIFVSNFLTYYFLLNYLKEKKLIDSKTYRIFTWLLIYFLSLSVLAYVFIEIYPVKIIATLMPLRGLFYFYFIYISMYGIVLNEFIKQKQFLNIILFLLPFVPILSNNIYYLTSAYTFLIICLLYNKFNKCSWFQSTENNYKRIKLDLLYLLVSFIFFSYSVYKFKIEIPTLGDSNEQLYSFIHKNTALDDLVLVDLASKDQEKLFFVNSKIRLLSRRAVILDESFPFLERYWLNWQSAYKEIRIQKPFSEPVSFSNVEQKKLEHYCSKYNVNIVVRSSKLNFSNNFYLLGNVGKFYIYKFNLSS
jgi:hypothetical protein